MKLHAPAKTFLLGEYVATIGGPAIVLATQPSFCLYEDNTVSSLVNIHRQSPAGLWYAKQARKPVGLVFTDPYQGMGGLGASSAQFVLVYQAVKNFQKQAYNASSLLEDYYRFAWHGKGVRPSGYDVLTQYSGSTIFIDSQGIKRHSLSWPFTTINALLIHTGNKLATHLHLEEQQQPSIDALQPIVYRAHAAWQQVDADAMVDAINAYHLELGKQQLVSPHTSNLIKQLSAEQSVFAAKGCGAMGADVILLLVDSKHTTNIKETINKKGLSLLAEIAISC